MIAWVLVHRPLRRTLTVTEASTAGCRAEEQHSGAPGGRGLRADMAGEMMS